MAGKLPKRKKIKPGNAQPSNAELVKSNRIRRRAIDRQNGVVKLKPKPPVAPILTFCLSRETTMVEYRLVKLGESGNAREPGGMTVRFDSVPVVLIRERKENKRKAGKRFITDIEFTKWREFHHAQPVREQDNTTSSSPFVLISAPITAWVVSGLHDGLVARDLPREEPKQQWVRKAEPAKVAA